MSIQTPPTLLVLAAKRLLRDQASAITALEYLPAELFPDLFVLAYRSGHHRQLLKAMAQAWPFTVLPLGVLMQRPPDHAPTSAVGLKAVFDALDVLLAQEIRPRRCKLRVLDLRNTGANFWNTWCRDNAWHCSLTGPVTVHSSSPNMEHPLAPLEVFLDLNFNERDRDKFSMHIIQWAQQREGLLHLCCKAVRISGVPFQRVRRVLDGVQLDCIQEVEVNCTWDLPTLGTFALFLGQMSNLQRLCLPHIQLLAEEDEDEEQEEEGEEEEQQAEEQEWEEAEKQEWEDEEEMEWEEEQRSFSQFLSQMLRLRHLRELDMRSPSFLRGRLDQMLRCLQTPFWTRCSAPLQDPGLDHCGMTGSQVEAILPALSRCHQLSLFSISRNSFPVATVEKLLRHTSGLCSLEVEVYPVPLECYRTQGTVDQERLALIPAKLTGILRELGRPRRILLTTKHCRHGSFVTWHFHDMEPVMCPCSDPAHQVHLTRASF
ncbi:PRAME family member 20-like [Myotis lucifugus]|uniref:PRAME family member 20-like n=1 Tax=Myotis lucifugus TaxID=59463 RepID=UPI0006D71763|nr:PRAME family member 20-like [Myotis lucifugus]